MAVETVSTISEVIATDRKDNADLMCDIKTLFAHPEEWLQAPNPNLMGHKPAEFLEPGREQPLRDLIGAIKYGLFR